MLWKLLVEDFQEAELADQGLGLASSEEKVETRLVVPRYARINTLKWSVEEALETLGKEEWKVRELVADEDLGDAIGALKFDEVLILL